MTKEAALRVEGSKDMHLHSAESTKKVPRKQPKEIFELPSLTQSVLVYIGYVIVFLFGYLDEFLRRIGVKRTTVPVHDKELEVSMQLGGEKLM